MMNRPFRIACLVCLFIAVTACNLSEDPNVIGNNGGNNGGSDDAATDSDDAVTDASSEDTAAEDGADDEDVTADDVADDDATSCTAPEERCGNTCVNTNTSVDHCGDCNSACAPPQNAEVDSCVDGDCQFRCAEGFYDLNDDLLADGCESACGPNAQEICGDGVDNNCDGTADENCDCDPDESRDCGTDVGECSTGTQTCKADGTWGTCQGQTQGTGEVCNGLDDDCDGDTDEGVQETFYYDNDGDGFGDGSNTTDACSAPTDYVDNSRDCNDNNADINPDATETCNGADDDCDSLTDEGVQTRYYFDEDGDGWGLGNDSQMACSASGKYRATKETDCDDTDDTVHPGVTTDDCDGTDSDCDGTKDEDGGSTKYHDGDGDGYGDPNDSMTACLFPADYINDNTDCDDSNELINPGASERCFESSTDYDCDGEPGCGDSDCDESYCTTSGGSGGYCISQTCVESGSCNFDRDCNSGLVCNNGCCCPNTTDPCLCAQ